MSDSQIEFTISYFFGSPVFWIPYSREYGVSSITATPPILTVTPPRLTVTPPIVTTTLAVMRSATHVSQNEGLLLQSALSKAESNIPAYLSKQDTRFIQFPAKSQYKFSFLRRNLIAVSASYQQRFIIKVECIENSLEMSFDNSAQFLHPGHRQNEGCSTYSNFCTRDTSKYRKTPLRIFNVLIFFTREK